MEQTQNSDTLQQRMIDAAINNNMITDDESKENSSTKEELTNSINLENNLKFIEKQPLTTSKSVPSGILRKKTIDSVRRDRLGTLIKHNSKNFESEFQGTPPKSRKRNTFQVTFKDKAEGGPLTKIVEVESYKKYNSLDPEVKL